MNLQPTHVSHEIIYETTRRVVISVSWEREEKKEKVERKGENERKKTMRLHHVPGNYIWAVKPSRDAGWPLTKVGKCNKIWCHDNDWRQIRWQKRAKFLFKKANSKKKKNLKRNLVGGNLKFFWKYFYNTVLEFVSKSVNSLKIYCFSSAFGICYFLSTMWSKMRFKGVCYNILCPPTATSLALAVCVIFARRKLNLTKNPALFIGII